MDELTIKLAKDLRAVLLQHGDFLGDTGVPFFGSFPENCCQGASVFLGMLLCDFLPRDTIKVTKGTTRDKVSHHYWVEVDSKIYDLTVDQFDERLGTLYFEIKTPIYSSVKHPLRQYFFYKERVSPVLAFSIFTTHHANLREVLPAYQFIRRQLEMAGWEFPRHNSP